MKSTGKRNLSKIDEIARKLGFEPYRERNGDIKEGFYSFKGLYAPIDLTASADDEISIMRNAVRQLSEQVDEQYHLGIDIERDLMS